MKNLELGVDVNKGSQYSGLTIIRGKFKCEYQDAKDNKLEPLFHVYKCVSHFYIETTGFGADKSCLFKMINDPQIEVRKEDAYVPEMDSADTCDQLKELISSIGKSSLKKKFI